MGISSEATKELQKVVLDPLYKMFEKKVLHLDETTTRKELDKWLISHGKTLSEESVKVLISGQKW